MIEVSENVLTCSYVLRYVIRRLLRYAKYAAVGAVAAVLGTTLLGTLGSGLAFFAAPGLLGGAGIGLATALAKVSLQPGYHTSFIDLLRPHRSLLSYEHKR
jgi:hypothetical protein